MKTFFISIFICFLLLSCGAKKELYNIECISIQNEGYVKLKLLNYEKPTEFNIESASKSAVKKNPNLLKVKGMRKAGRGR